MPKAYEMMRDRFAKGAKEDSPEYNAAQSKAARIYNSSYPGHPVDNVNKYEKSKRRKRRPLHVN